MFNLHNYFLMHNFKKKFIKIESYNALYKIKI